MHYQREGVYEDLDGSDLAQQARQHRLPHPLKPYLLLFPFTPVGLAILLGIGTLVMALLRRRDDIVTTGITTAVVMVVAAMSPNDAWQQPLLRLFDTVVGIALGVICKLIGSYLFFLGERLHERDS